MYPTETFKLFFCESQTKNYAQINGLNISKTKHASLINFKGKIDRSSEKFSIASFCISKNKNRLD